MSFQPYKPCFVEDDNLSKLALDVCDSPLADKFLVNSVLIILCACANTGSNKLITHDIIYMFFILDTVLMIGRDIAVDGLRLVASVNGEVIAANIYGKIKTVMQMIVLPILMLGGFPYSLLTLANVSEDVISGISLALLTITCIMSLISGVIYIYRGKSISSKTNCYL